MAISEIGRLGEVEGWAQPVEGSVASRAARAFWSFARRKPLGAVCGLVVIAFIVVGDLVPETLNKASSVAGFGTPVPLRRPRPRHGRLRRRVPVRDAERSDGDIRRLLRGYSRQARLPRRR